jgi:hypothetical protein
MKYDDRIVCFLDILGFKNHIDRTVCADGTDAVESITNLQEAFDSVRDLLDIDRPEERPDKEVMQFSDSVAVVPRKHRKRSLRRTT